MNTHQSVESSTGNLKNWVIRLAMGIAGVLVAAFVAFMRMPPTSRGVVWAEDGGIFLHDAMERKGFLDIFSPYEGYLHVVPRFAAKATVSLFRIDDYGFAMSLLSCVVVGLVAWGVLHCSKAFTSNVYARLGWASITIFVAPAPIETLGNFANIHSYLLWLTPWLMLKPAKSRLEAALLFCAAILVSLTEIVAVLFIPLFAVRFKDRSLWAAKAGLALGLFFQFVTTVVYPRTDNGSYPIDIWSIVIGWFLNSSSALVYGTSGTIGANVQNYGFWAVLLAAVPFAAAWIFVLAQGTANQLTLGITLVGASVAVWGATMLTNFKEYFHYAAFDSNDWATSFFLSRYSTVPSMFLLALLPLVALCDSSKRQRIAVGAMTALVALQFVYFLPPGTARNNGPDWQDGIEAARVQCIANPLLETSPVTISPVSWLKSGVAVPCGLLRPTP